MKEGKFKRKLYMFVFSYIMSLCDIVDVVSFDIYVKCAVVLTISTFTTSTISHKGKVYKNTNLQYHITDIRL